MKNIISDIKNRLERIKSRLDEAVKIINELEDKVIKHSSRTTKRNINLKSIEDSLREL